MNTLVSDDCHRLWRELVDAESRFYSVRAELFSKCKSALVEVVRGGFNIPRERATALGVATLLTTEELQQLFPDLLSLACFTHGLTDKAREIVLSMPRNWLLSNIERSAEKLLQHEDYEEYSGILQIYMELDHDLTMKLAQRASTHFNEEIREVGQQYLALLKSG